MVSYSDQYVALAALSSFLFGYQIAVLNTALIIFTLMFEGCGDTYTYRCSTATEWESLIETMVFVGATVGSLTGGYFASKGRRFVLLISHVISIIGSAVCCCAFNYPSLLVGRLLCGFCVGLVTVVSPTLISEICPAKIRGSRGTMHQLSITVGIMVAVALGVCLAQPPKEADISYVMGSFDRNWARFMQAFPGILSAFGMILMVSIYKDDTPQALLGRGQTESAAKILSKIYRVPGEAKAQLEELTAQMQHSQGEGEFSAKPGFFTMLKQPGVLRAFVVGCVLSFGQQAGGINAFVARSSQIFRDSGMSPELTARMSTVMGVVNVVMTFPAIFVIDTLGRKPLMLIGIAGQAIMLSMVPFASLLGYSIATASVISVIGYIVFFATAYGPVLWVYLFEIYPPEFKGTATGLASGLNWVTGSLVVYFNSRFSKDYTTANFTVFTVVCVLILLFCIFFVKETKGSSRSPFLPAGTAQEKQPLTA